MMCMDCPARSRGELTWAYHVLQQSEKMNIWYKQATEILMQRLEL